MLKLKTSYYKIFAAFIFLLIISACSNTKFLQEGQMLYTGAKPVSYTHIDEYNRQDEKDESKVLVAGNVEKMGDLTKIS